MFVCEKNSSCIGCNYQYADRLDDIDEEFRDCDKLIEVQEVKHGKWEHDKDDVIISGYCSICGWYSVVCETDVAGMPYCPNCGAKMDLQ